MMNSRQIAIAAMTTAFAATMVSAHLPSMYDASLKMGKIGFGDDNSRAATTYKNKGAWHPDSIYRGDYTITQGDTVSHGEFNGKKLWWWAKFYANGASLTPGQFAPEGGTSPWVLINSLSASENNGKSSFKARVWNNDIQNSISGLAAVVPTWRDGATGAYSMTHDDIGAMPFETSVKPAFDLAKDYPEIKQCWGAYVEKMDKDWGNARDMVLAGHEIFNHSMRHTSAADQWQWFYPGQTIPAHDPAIPEEIKGLKVVGTWGTMIDNAAAAKLPYPTPNTNGQITLSSDLVSIKCTEYWTRNAPNTEPVGTTLTWEGKPIQDAQKNNIVVIEPVVTAKSGVQTITLKTGQKLYVKYTKRDETGAGLNEGVIAATGVTWLEVDQLKQYGEKGWENPSDCVIGDKGAPGFVAKVYCVKKWEPKDYKDNIQDASAAIDANVYAPIISAGEHFRKGKRVEYYGYPFDAYSEVTHDSLEANGFVGARGGAKSGRPIPGDFFHPYRIDFDAFYITKSDWDVNKSDGVYIYPENPHVLLGANQMIDKIIENKGYMIREFHAVADIPDGAWHSSEASEQWPLNSAAKDMGGWWGGITKNQLKAHYDYIQKKIESNDITVFTVGEITKYRMTANATSGVTITENGGKYVLTPTTKEAIKDKYKDEISVIVSFPNAMKSVDKGFTRKAGDFAVTYNKVDNSWGASPRRQPRQLDDAGKVWSISINPFLGAVTIDPNSPWVGQPISINDAKASIKTASSVQFAGIRDGQVALNLPAGTFTAELFSVSGRKVASATVTGSNQIVRTGLNTQDLGAGMFFLNVKTNGASVMQHKLMIK